MANLVFKATLGSSLLNSLLRTPMSFAVISEILKDPRSPPILTLDSLCVDPFGLMIDSGLFVLLRLTAEAMDRIELRRCEIYPRALSFSSKTNSFEELSEARPTIESMGLSSRLL